VTTAGATSTETAREPLLAVDDARVDLDGVPACDGLTLRTTSERALVLGAPRALFLAAAGLAPVVRGDVRVRGTSAVAAVRSRVVAGSPLDPPLPPKWTALEYATWSARLAGHPKRDAAALAREALDKLQLPAKDKALLPTLPPHARRAVVLAGAMATGAEVVAIEDPLGGFPEEIAVTWARLLTTALEGRPWLVFAPRVPLTSPLAQRAEEAIVVSGARVDAQASPAALAAEGDTSRRFVARVQGPVASLGPRLADRGARLETAGASPARVVVDLGPELTTAELLALCVDAGVTVVELFPVARALA
jgi:hypothetical protein